MPALRITYRLEASATGWDVRRSCDDGPGAIIGPPPRPEIGGPHRRREDALETIRREQARDREAAARLKVAVEHVLQSGETR